MATPLSINSQIHDIEIDVSDSCNCCCWGSPPPPSTPVYINSAGRAVKFDAKKADDERQAMARSIANLQAHITKLAELHPEDSLVIMSEIDEHVGETFDPSDPDPLTVDVVERVNEAIKKVFSRSSSGSPQPGEIFHA